LGIYLKEWGEDTYTWSYITPTNYPLAVGIGYEVWSTLGNPTVSYSGGVLNSGDISPALIATDVNGGGIGENEGWNFVGNPYPSAIDWGTNNNPVSGYVRTNIDNAIYIWNGAQYGVYNPSLNGGNGSGTNGASQVIQSMQSFFVKANSTGPALTIPNGARQHSSLSNLKSSEEIQRISLSVDGNGETDEIYIEVNEGSTPGFDQEFDAYKLWGNESVPQLYIVATGNEQSVHVVPEIDSEDIISIGFKAGEENTFSITADQIQNFENYEVVLLEDKLTNTQVNLQENSEYSFAASPQDDPERFNLRFKSMEEIELNKAINIYSYRNSILVQVYSDAPDQTLTVYDMLGQFIGKMDLVNYETNTFEVRSGIGFYMAKVRSGNQVLTEKVLIK